MDGIWLSLGPWLTQCVFTVSQETLKLMVQGDLSHSQLPAVTHLHIQLFTTPTFRGARFPRDKTFGESAFEHAEKTVLVGPTGSIRELIPGQGG